MVLAGSRLPAARLTAPPLLHCHGAMRHPTCVQSSPLQAQEHRIPAGDAAEEHLFYFGSRLALWWLSHAADAELEGQGFHRSGSRSSH